MQVRGAQLFIPKVRISSATKIEGWHEVVIGYVGDSLGRFDQLGGCAGVDLAVRMTLCFGLDAN